MDQSTARTILHLNEQRNRAVAERRQSLLRQAELEHELKMLRHMRREIVSCLLDRRSTGKKRETPADYTHTIGRIARIVRNT